MTQFSFQLAKRWHENHEPGKIRLSGWKAGNLIDGWQARQRHAPRELTLSFAHISCFSWLGRSDICNKLVTYGVSLVRGMSLDYRSDALVVAGLEKTSVLAAPREFRRDFIASCSCDIKFMTSCLLWRVLASFRFEAHASLEGTVRLKSEILKQDAWLTSTRHFQQKLTRL